MSMSLLLLLGEEMQLLDGDEMRELLVLLMAVMGSVLTLMMGRCLLPSLALFFFPFLKIYNAIRYLNDSGRDFGAHLPPTIQDPLLTNFHITAVKVSQPISAHLFQGTPAARGRKNKIIINDCIMLSYETEPGHFNTP